MDVMSVLHVSLQTRTHTRCTHQTTNSPRVSVLRAQETPASTTTQQQHQQRNEQNASASNINAAPHQRVRKKSRGQLLVSVHARTHRRRPKWYSGRRADGWTDRRAHTKRAPRQYIDLGMGNLGCPIFPNHGQCHQIRSNQRVEFINLL